MPLGFFHAAQSGHVRPISITCRLETTFELQPATRSLIDYQLPWEPKTFIFRGYNPYIGGLKPSFFMVLGSKGMQKSIVKSCYGEMSILCQKCPSSRDGSIDARKWEVFIIRETGGTLQMVP